MPVQSNALATCVANRLSADPNGPMRMIDIVLILTLIQLLLPIIIKCFDPDDGEQVQKYLLARYAGPAPGDKYGGYKRLMVRVAAREVKRAGRQNDIAVTWDQAIAVVIALFDEVRLCNTQQLSLVIRENN